MKGILSNSILIAAIVLSTGIVLLKVFKLEPKNTIASLSNGYIELGEVAQDFESEVYFYLINRGENLLHVKDLVPDCYCTVPAWNKQPILPGDSLRVTVIHKTNNIGYFQQDVRIYLNTVDSPLILTIKGRVIPKE